MLKSQIKKGSEYAFRDKPKPGLPFHRVRILEHVRGNKWKVEWVEPNPGLVHYVESSQLITPWKECRLYLKEEEARERLRNYNRRLGYDDSSPIGKALYNVFESIGDELSFYRGVLSGSEQAFERVRTRAHAVPGSQSTVAYKDRQGALHVPFDEALELARKFSAAEPESVLAKVEATEREWAEEARRPGEEYLVGLLNEFRAAWALVRQWAGLDAAISQRENQIKKLERLVWDAIYALQKAGLDSESARLRRALERK
jgi:hypothetical protein